MRRTVSYLGLGAAALAGAAYVARRRAEEGPPLPTVEGGERTKVETSDGAVLDVHVAGDGPAVVLPHCWTGTMEVWAPVAARLVAAGHRVVRYDQRGHGGSTVGSGGFTIERFGDDLRDVLEALDVRDAVVAGHSLGGMTAQSFAIRHPEALRERVRALVLVGTAPAAVVWAPLARVTRRLMRSPKLENRMRARGGSPFVRGVFGARPNRAAVLATRDAFVNTSPDVRVGVLDSMLNFDLRPQLHTITVPTVIVSGTRDTLTPPRWSRAIAKAIPGARLETVKGAGHMLPYEVPDLLVGLIQQL
jgi:non-heme chloroperoxidase